MNILHLIHNRFVLKSLQFLGLYPKQVDLRPYMRWMDKLYERLEKEGAL